MQWENVESESGSQTNRSRSCPPLGSWIGKAGTFFTAPVRVSGLGNKLESVRDRVVNLSAHKSMKPILNIEYFVSV